MIKKNLLWTSLLGLSFLCPAQEADTSLNISGVIVRGVKPKNTSPTTFQSLSGEDIYKENKGREITYLLGTTPSVINGSDAGTGIGYTNMRIRGVDDTRINVSVNGIPLNDAESHQTYMVNMPDLASSVDEINIQRGVGNSMNGSAAFGGSVNFQTGRQKSKPYGSYEGTYGSFNTLKNTISFGTGIQKGFAVDGRLSHIRSDGYIDRASADLKSYYISAGYYGKKHTVKFVHFMGKEITYSAWDGVPKDSLSTNPTYNPQGEYTNAQGEIEYYKDQKDSYQQAHYQLFYAGDFTDKWKFNAALHYTKGGGYYEQYKPDAKLKKYGLPDSLGKTDLIRRKHLDNHFAGLVASVIYEPIKSLQITLGGGVNHYQGEHFGDIIWLLRNQGLQDHYPYYNGKGIKTDGNVYLKADYQIGIFNLYADLQYRHVDYKIKGMTDVLVENQITTPYDIHQKYNFFNPKVGLSSSWIMGQMAYLSFAVANREPNRKNFTNTTSPDQMPKPERLYDVEMGYKWRTAKTFLYATAYMMYYKDQLVLTGEISNTGGALQRNVAQSFRAGIELSFDYQITEKLKWTINATFSQNKILNYMDFIPTYDVDYNPIGNGYTEVNMEMTTIALSPDIIGYTRFSYTPVKNLELSIDGKFVGRQYIDNSFNKDRSINPYFINNFKISYAFHPKWMQEISLWAGVYNFTNRKYQSSAWVSREYVGGELYTYDGYFSQAHINFLAGVKIAF